MPTFKDITNAKPYEERTPNSDYKEMLKEVYEKGIKTESQQGVDAYTRIAPKPMRFKFENGFPVLTERNLAPEMKTLPVTIWKQAIAEICAFINGARTVKEFEKFGCYWWDVWCTEKKCAKRGLETGDLGPGSYGAAFHNFPMIDGGTFNQFQHIVEQIKEEPQLRTHFISPWIPQYTGRGKGKQQKVVVCPCHGWINIRIINGKMTLHMMQRSGDTPIGVPSNIVQYAALALMIAHVTGVEPYEYVHTISDAHIYEDQIPAVEKILEREPRNLPTMKINTDVKNLFDFRKEDFELSDYHPHPGIKGIPVAI